MEKLKSPIPLLFTIIVAIIVPMEYIYNIIGAPYNWWISGTTLGGDTAPFWNSNGPPPSPTKIHEAGLNCAGFVNLICRNFGIPIPGLDEGDFYAGGTWYWFRHVQDRLQSIDCGSVLEPGTLLLIDYESVDFQGHVGIVVGPNEFAHCIPERGVVIESASKIPTYFTHCVPGFFPSWEFTREFTDHPYQPILPS